MFTGRPPDLTFLKPDPTGHWRWERPLQVAVAVAWVVPRGPENVGSVGVWPFLFAVDPCVLGGLVGA